MADKTKIEWTDATWNPVTGCAVVSAGCRNCYAMRLAGTRLRHHPSRAGLTTQSKRGAVWTGGVRFNPGWLTLPLQWSRPRKIFVCAHGDLFHPRVPFAWVDRVFAVMALTPHHTHQVLTKRPDRMRAYLETPERKQAIARAVMDVSDMRAFEVSSHRGRVPLDTMSECFAGDGPFRNVWLGTSVEDQSTADQRREDLAAIAAQGWTTFASYEPALGPVDWQGWSFLRWLISGGEAGPDARPSHPQWHRAARDFCAREGIAFLFKQWGAWGRAVPRPSGTPGDFAIATAGPFSVSHRPIVVQTDHYPRAFHLFGGATVLERLGKGSTGRLLDGRTHDDFPAAA